MRFRPRRLPGALVIVALVALGACASSTGGSDADQNRGVPAISDTTPAESHPDSSVGDARRPGRDPADGDAGAGDAEILGTLTSGACGDLRAKLASPEPALAINHLAFVTGETYTRAALSPGGQTLFETANAGGSSGESEVISYEVLRYCEGAKLLKTETQIGYTHDDAGANTITDLEVEIDGQKVGVSVTRAYKPSDHPLTDADVLSLLEKKLEGVNRSTQRVVPEDRWIKQILHVFAANPAATDAVRRIWPTLDSRLRADTIVLVTETSGGGFVYCNPDPPLGAECPP